MDHYTSSAEKLDEAYLETSYHSNRLTKGGRSGNKEHFKCCIWKHKTYGDIYKIILLCCRSSGWESSGQENCCLSNGHNTMSLVQLKPSELVVPTDCRQASHRAGCQRWIGQWQCRKILVEHQQLRPHTAFGKVDWQWNIYLCRRHGFRHSTH